MLKDESLEAAIETAADLLGVRPFGTREYGWNEKSIGSEVFNSKGSFWLRVVYRERGTPPSKLWTGLADAQVLTDVKKPTLVDHAEWASTSRIYRAELMNLIKYDTCSPSAVLRTSISISSRWLSDLYSSLASLTTQSTDRVNTRQDLISRRISERFGVGVPTEVHNWVTVHGDIHWANVTCSECWILDWEAWGLGPFGLDPAFLYCFTQLEPAMAERILARFQAELNSRDGRVSLLFACAELIRMSEVYGDYPDLRPHLVALSGTVIDSLRSEG